MIIFQNTIQRSCSDSVVKILNSLNSRNRDSKSFRKCLCRAEIPLEDIDKT
ncbi:hypothetical protein A3Q56_05379 [Intoshia linei]|uniref:Uncharacterized protein n=1 Tax=Intoshia linei TaxID=1819745 RepID=A0A177AY42_9BILA|nr:hypothetical protein A3Q56_05379 [Intoshia linei]